MSDTPPLLPEDVHNLELAANVHPARWVNPEPAPRYDLVIVGAGPAGLVAASAAAGLGVRRVALVERAWMGGDCLNVGCVPSKALLRSARAWAAVRDAGEFGVDVPAGAKVDFGRVMERMRRLRTTLSSVDSAVRYRKLGVDIFFGQARFTGLDRLAVAGRTLPFRKAILATGARAAQPDIPNLDEVGYFTNETVFTLTELPPRLAVVGAGPLGCELAQAFARFGSAVTLIANHGQVLPREDLDAALLVQQALQRDGVRVWTNCHATGALKRNGEKVLQVRHLDRPVELDVDAILLAVGRTPNVEELHLETGAVAHDAAIGIHVDDRLRTTNRRVYAAGDCCARLQFTHAADAMARLAVRNALFPGHRRASSLVIPWCTYTDPEVAHVGLYEHEAREAGMPVATITQPLDHVDRAVLDGETAGFARVHVRAGTDRIVGATIVAAHAGEMMGEMVLAMTAGLGLRELADTVHPYPTQAEALRKLGDAYNRTRLTGWVKWLLGWWLG
jgi:pyruvate/2-oxoglutarate dehydrogenase complex dihydrolipoamide dehydrogenase (E3) component